MQQVLASHRTKTYYSAIFCPQQHLQLNVLTIQLKMKLKAEVLVFKGQTDTPFREDNFLFVIFYACGSLCWDAKKYLFSELPHASSHTSELYGICFEM